MLATARQRAVELNQVGALYPWRTINGEEASAYYAAGTAQYHINAAIAFALKRYLDASGDIAFLAGEGAEILVETARLWEDLGFYAANGEEVFRIHGVTGPDEYTTVVNDNLYTNVMARFNLRYAARVVELLRGVGRRGLRAACAGASACEPDETKRWTAASDAMYLPYDEELGIHPQDDSFLEREPWDFEHTPPDNYPLLLHYHPLVIYRHQVLKQADVVLAMVLRSDQFTLEQKRRNFDYYDPITTGDSSLSACVQAMAAAQIGYDELAVAYFREALFVDLADTHGNASDGVHIASAGGVWGTIVFGFAGLYDTGTALRFTPSLPSAWERRDVPDATTRRRGCASSSTPTAARSTVLDGPPRPDRERRRAHASVVARRARLVAPRRRRPADRRAYDGLTARRQGVAMKSIFFHLMPYRDLPDDFEERYESVWVTPPNSELCDPAKVAQYYKWNLDELELADRARLRRHRRQRAPPERLRVHGLAEPDGRGAGPADAEQQRHPRARQHARAVHAGAARGRGVRHARLHDRRPPGRRLPGRHVDGRQPLLRHHADRDPAPLLRGPRPDHEGVDAARPVPLQRPVQQAALRQPVAAAAAEAAPAGVAGRRRLGRDVRDGRQLRLHVQLPQLLRLPASPRR